jgi:hypothetical protein
MLAQKIGEIVHFAESINQNKNNAKTTEPNEQTNVINERCYNAIQQSESELCCATSLSAIDRSLRSPAFL